MKTKELIKKARKFARPFRVDDGGSFRLKDVDPADTLHLDSEDKPRAKEALAMGIPVVVPARGVFPELLALTGGGVLVEEDTPQAYAAALKPWLLDPEAARALGRQGRLGVEEHFDVEKTGAELIGVLEGIVRKGN